MIYVWLRVVRVIWTRYDLRTLLIDYVLRLILFAIYTPFYFTHAVERVYVGAYVVLHCFDPHVAFAFTFTLPVLRFTTFDLIRL